jgi:hypothetical protein
MLHVKKAGRTHADANRNPLRETGRSAGATASLVEFDAALEDQTAAGDAGYTRTTTRPRSRLPGSPRSSLVQDRRQEPRAVRRKEFQSASAPAHALSLSASGVGAASGLFF